MDPDGNNPIDAFKIFFTPGNTIADVYRYEIRKEEIKFAQAYDFVSEKVMEGAKFISENGCIFSIIANASGNVEIAIAIDSTIFICDITVAYDDYDKSSKTKEDLSRFRSKVFATVLSTAISGLTSATAEKYFTKVVSEEYVKRISNSLGSFIGSEFNKMLNEQINKKDN